MKSFTTFIEESSETHIPDVTNDKVILEAVSTLAADAPEAMPSRLKRIVVNETDEAATYVIHVAKEYLERIWKNSKPSDRKRMMATSPVTVVMVRFNEHFGPEMSQKITVMMGDLPALMAALKKAS